MIERLLIANRGEIALRIIHTCRRLGIETVAVYSESDVDQAFVRAASQAIALGGVRAEDSYLNIEAILRAIQTSGADAVHPGYGFLSENVAFAERLEQLGVRFVGPTAQTLRELGEKDQARRLAQALSIPVAPGYDGPDQSTELLLERASELGFPLLIKAAAGGGGRGMRLVAEAAQFAGAVESAKREARASFGDDRLILERCITPARHIEVQLLGDGTGTVLHFFERDCSWQRRYQKVLEEAPARNLPTSVQAAVIRDAVKLAAHSKLRSAATAEFLVSSADGTHYFLEVNPRLQVEHPVTELATGFDLVELQLQIAAGLPLTLRQDEIRLQRTAIEARVYAEIPEQGSIPSIGRIERLELPPRIEFAQPTSGGCGVRIDHGLAVGVRVSPHFDPMLAKLIGYGSSHEESRLELLAALASCDIAGVATNLGFLHALLDWSGTKPVVHTEELQHALETLGTQSALAARAESALEVHLGIEREYYRSLNADFFPDQSRTEGRKRRFRIECPNMLEPKLATITDSAIGQTASFARPFVVARVGIDECGGLQTELLLDGYRFTTQEARTWEIAGETSAASGTQSNEVRAPLPGTIVSVPVAAGEAVQRGTTLVVIESMKMEHALRATENVIVESVEVVLNAAVQRGALLLRLRRAES